MASDKSPATARGLLIADPRISPSSIWSAQSSYTQAGPEPGIPAAQGAYDLGLISRGTQLASQALRIRGQRSGGVGLRGPAGIVWKGSTDTNYRGKDSMGVISHFEAVTWLDGSGDPVSTADPYVLALSDHSVLVAYYAQSSAGNHEVHVKSRSAAGVWSSAVVVYSTSVAPSSAISSSFQPCMYQLPDARIVLLCKLEESDTCQIQVYESTDAGGSWTMQTRRALPTAIDTSSGSSGWVVREPIAAYQNGQVLLLINAVANETNDATSGNHEYRQALWQYASDSSGLDYVAIREPTSLSSDRQLNSTTSQAPPSRFLAATPMLRAHGGYFWLFYATDRRPGVYLAPVTHGDYLGLDRLGSAFRHIQTADHIGTFDTATRLATQAATTGAVLNDSNRYATEADMAVAIGDDGTFYVAARALDETQQIFVMRSIDQGITWQSIGANAEISGSSYNRGIAWASGDSSTHPIRLAMAYSQGRLLMASNVAAAPGNEDNSIIALYLGGWTTVTTPPIYTYSDGTELGAWSRNWVAIEEPGDVAGWTTAGAGTDLIGTASLGITTTSSAHRYYHRAFTSTAAQGSWIRFAMKCDHGDAGSAEVGVRLRSSNGSADKAIEFRFTAAGWTVYDANGTPSQLASVTVDMTSPREFMAFFTGGTVAVLKVRSRAYDNSADREWSSHAMSAPGTAGGAAANLVQWGHLEAHSGLTDNQSSWYEFHIGYGAQAGLGPSSIDTNPDDLSPARVGAGSAQTYIDGGVSVSATSSPARVGETFHVDTRYTYPIERIFHQESPSPRVRWRSTSTAEHTIALQLDAITTEASLAGNDVIGLTLLAPNFRTATLEGYNVGTTAWVTIAAIDTSSGMASLAYTRKAGSVAPGAGSADTFYLHTNELAGGWLGLNGSTIRKISANTDGQWAGSLTRKLPTILIDAATTGDPSTGSAGFLIPPVVTVIAKLNGAIYGGYRLKIASQTAGGGAYFELGGLIVGWVDYFARQYSWGRVLSSTANTELTRQLDGTVTSRVHGPAYRTVKFAWSDGVDSSQVEGAAVDPDYILNSADGSAKPVGSPAETPYLMEGLVSLLNPDGGPARAVVYLPAIPKSGNTITLNRRHQAIAGRVTSPVQIESIQGDETSDEVWRVASVTIEESV